MTKLRLDELRLHYNMGDLSETDCLENPFTQFETWIARAIDENLVEPNAMTLSTVGTDHQPSSRILLLKDILEDGFSFFTNYDSKKGHQLLENSKAAMLFWWREHERQVRIEGIVSRLDKASSEAYFHARPRGSQIGAWASPQSQVVHDRDQIDHLYEEKKKLFSDDTVIPLPAHWGGYILKPHLFEFWQGRPNRLHDRIQYRLENNVWVKERLAP